MNMGIKAGQLLIAGMAVLLASSGADHDWPGITNKEKNKPTKKGQRTTDNLTIAGTCETDSG